MAQGGGALDFFQGEVGLQLGLQALLARDADHILRMSAFLGRGAKELHQLGFIDILAPVAHHSLQGRGAARVRRCIGAFA